ncbi:hypothetical protein NQ317_017045 [Molorchus minor]|uniref:MCM AAA-lid domain-containing protein n=1 Tax=Molorchus minor TaxID=1323400 RepID=A0ABQ9K4B1_9CUCU|nr:hypothetical protein NQ317_017045 [Molorchus minor]
MSISFLTSTNPFFMSVISLSTSFLNSSTVSSTTFSIYSNLILPNKSKSILEQGVNRVWRHNFKVTAWLIHSLIYTNVCRISMICQLKVLPFDLFANCFKSLCQYYSLSKRTKDCLTCTKNPIEQDGEVLPMGTDVDILSTINPDDVEGEREIPVYEKYDALLHGTSRRRTDKILSVDFMRKYIHFVKILKPTLTEQASEIIADEYSKLRSEDILDKDVARTQPVTPRTLETMIRLATAHAKARMSRTVDSEDANAAIELIHYAYFKKVLEKEKKRRRNVDDTDEEDSDSDQRPKRTRQKM